MNIVTATSAWPSLATQASTGATTGPATDATAVTAPATTVVEGHHRHHEHHGEDDEHHGHHDQQAYMALQIKVEQTFSALTSSGANAAATDPNAPAPAADGDSDEDGGGFAATLKAKFSLSQGGLSASLSIRMESEGQAGSADLAAQMQGFVQTLYAALHTLFGGNAANPNTTLGTPVNTGAAAALTGSAGAAAAPTTAGTTSPTADAAASPAGADASAAPATDAGASAAAGTAATSPSANASGSLSIKLRLTYNSFGSQLGPLTQQLAQPGAAQAAPGMADLLGDLSTRFGQLLSASPAGSGSGLSLGDFLNALAQSFAPATTAQAPANDAGAAAAATPDASAVPDTAAPASSPMPASVAYGQVLSFSASVRSQWQLAA